MDDKKLILGVAGTTAVVLLGSLFYIVNSLPITLLKIIATLALFLLLPMLILGFWLGKVEARGMLSGIDSALEKGFNLFQSTVEFRDTSRIKIHQAGVSPVAWQPPQIAARVSSADMIEIV